jgi:hypothetical protein
MSLIATKIPSVLFSWRGNLGVTEASDLNRIGFLGRIWDDACDQGFAVVSGKTGKLVIFYLDYTDWGFGRNQDVEQDEIAGWHFKSTCGRYTILIIND